MNGAAWLRRWMGSPAPAREWADDCPAGLPVPEANSCTAATGGCDSLPLTLLTPGQRAWVTCLQQPGGRLAAKLGALGLLPGMEVEVVERFPAFVLRLGYAEIAIDEALASTVRVRRT